MKDFWTDAENKKFEMALRENLHIKDWWPIVTKAVDSKTPRSVKDHMTLIRTKKSLTETEA